jgi:hypothetical protein
MEYIIGNHKIFQKFDYNVRASIRLSDRNEAVYAPFIMNFSLSCPKILNNKSKNIFCSNHNYNFNKYIYIIFLIYYNIIIFYKIIINILFYKI